MAVPTVPTTTSLLTESFRRCGIPTPTVAQLLRAEDEWLEEVKQELDAEKRWHNLEDTQVVLTVAYQQAYTIPSPLFRILRIRFYDGDVKGTATAGGATTITVATGDDNDLGRKIFLTGGTGSGQVNRIISRSGTTYTVQNTWVTNPTSGTTYMIANIEQELQGPYVGIRQLGNSPSNLCTHWEEFEAQFMVFPIPNLSTYAFEVDGIVDISLVDETDARLTRLLREWRIAIVLGVMTRIQQEQNDDQLAVTQQLYDKAILRLKIKDSRKRRGITPAAMRGPGGMPMSGRGRYR